ncbi:MAG: hypothetical protein Kow0037_24160 [Calditrichia bacterium]
MIGLFAGILQTVAQHLTLEHLEWARLPLYWLFFVRQPLIVPDYRQQLPIKISEAPVGRKRRVS